MGLLIAVYVVFTGSMTTAFLGMWPGTIMWAEVMFMMVWTIPYYGLKKSKYVYQPMFFSLAPYFDPSFAPLFSILTPSTADPCNDVTERVDSLLLSNDCKKIRTIQPTQPEDESAWDSALTGTGTTQRRPRTFTSSQPVTICGLSLPADAFQSFALAARMLRFFVFHDNIFVYQAFYDSCNKNAVFSVFEALSRGPKL